jgi:hypothetical protein
VSGQLHVPAALPPGKEPPIPIRYEVGCTPESVWTSWRKFLTHRDYKILIGKTEEKILPGPVHHRRMILKWNFKLCHVKFESDSAGSEYNPIAGEHGKEFFEFRKG